MAGRCRCGCPTVRCSAVPAAAMPTAAPMPACWFPPVERDSGRLLDTSYLLCDPATADESARLAQWARWALAAEARFRTLRHALDHLARGAVPAADEAQCRAALMALQAGLTALRLECEPGAVAAGFLALAGRAAAKAAQAAPGALVEGLARLLALLDVLEGYPVRANRAAAADPVRAGYVRCRATTGIRRSRSVHTLATDQAEGLRRAGAARHTAHRRGSQRAGAGATTVALGLASALAMQGERVLLVDEDARARARGGAAPRGALAGAGRTGDARPCARCRRAQRCRRAARGRCRPGRRRPAGHLRRLPHRAGRCPRRRPGDAVGAGRRRAQPGGDAPRAASITAAYARINNCITATPSAISSSSSMRRRARGIAGAVAGNVPPASISASRPRGPAICRSIRWSGRASSWVAAWSMPTRRTGDDGRRIASSIGAWPMRAASTTFPGVASATPPTSPRIH